MLGSTQISPIGAKEFDYLYHPVKQQHIIVVPSNNTHGCVPYSSRPVGSIIRDIVSAH